MPIFYSLGERYGLRIIPGSNSFLVLPTNISRSTAVGAILQLGSQAALNSPTLSSSPASAVTQFTTLGAAAPNVAAAWRVGSAPWMSPDVGDTPTINDDLEFVLAVSSDEKLIRRLNELDNSETCSTSGKGTDAKWGLDPKEAVGVLKRFAEA